MLVAAFISFIKFPSSYSLVRLSCQNIKVLPPYADAIPGTYSCGYKFAVVVIVILGPRKWQNMLILTSFII